MRAFKAGKEREEEGWWLDWRCWKALRRFSFLESTSLSSAETVFSVVSMSSILGMGFGENELDENLD